MPGNPIMECFSRDLLHKYCQGLESSAVYTPGSLLCQIHPWSPKSESNSRGVVSACTGCYSYIDNVKLVYWTMPAQNPPSGTSPLIANVWSLANRQNQQMSGPTRNSQFPLANWSISGRAVERDSSPGGTSEAWTIQGQNSTSCSLQNNSSFADITQLVASTQSPTQRLCKGTYGSVWHRRHTDGNYRNTVANVDASDSRCRYIVWLSLEIEGSWRANYIEWPLPGPGSRAAITLSSSFGTDLLGCINCTKERERKESFKESCRVRHRMNP